MNKNILKNMIFTIKANHAWFHAAHHVAKGESFIGDHDKLYGDIYQSLHDSLDQMIEKSISITECEDMACPIMIAEGSLSILSSLQPPINLSGREIAELALEIELEFLLFLEVSFRQLEKSHFLSLGMNDFVSAMANQHESFVYKLKQRVKC